VRNRPYRPRWGEGDGSTDRAPRSRSRPRCGRVATTVDRDNSVEKDNTIQNGSTHDDRSTHDDHSTQDDRSTHKNLITLKNGNNAHRVRQRTDKVEP
jgi:hypothetical protein